MRVQEIIRRPLITEKSSVMREGLNIIAFEVHRDANKIQVKRAVESVGFLHHRRHLEQAAGLFRARRARFEARWPGGSGRA